MSYSVEIERIGLNGLPVGRAVVKTVNSEGEALALMRDAIRRAYRTGRMMTFSVYGAERRHMVSYTSAGLAKVAKPTTASAHKVASSTLASATP